MATGQKKPKLSPTDEERIRKLFKELDVNNDGHIDASELNAGLKRLGVPNIPGQAEAVVNLSDQNNDGVIDFGEFVDYVRNHEEKLLVVFKKLDLNEDGQIDKEEMINSLKQLGIPATNDEVDKLMKKIDSDGNLMITWDEWREFLLLQPHTTVKSILEYWKHTTNVNIGEADTIVIPEEFSEEEKTSGKWWRQLVAGGGAGAVSRTCTAPLDRLKIFFMVSSMQGQRFTIMSGLRYMVEEGGLRSLWRGNGVNVIKIAPESALRFFAYERVKKLLKDGNEPLQVHERLLAGSTAGVIAQTTIYPLEVMKTRLALGKTGQYRGLMDCARHTLRTEGLRTFYKGLSPSLLGIIPYAGIDLAVYETLKGLWMHREGWEHSSIVIPLACGTVSSTCGQLASYPLSLVRTRLQAQVGSTKNSTTHNLSMLETFRTIWTSEGVRGLYRGIFPNFLKVAPAVSIAYVVYEQLKVILGVPTV